MFAGIALAQAGAISLTAVVALGTAASFLANTLYYYLGRLLWKRWSFLRQRFGKRVEDTSPVVMRYGASVMLAARFFYGIRDIVPITLGLYGVSAGGFILFNILGAFLWAFLFTVFGNAFADFFLHTFRSVELVVIGSLMAGSMGTVAYALVRRAVSKLRG